MALRARTTSENVYLAARRLILNGDLRSGENLTARLLQDIDSVPFPAAKEALNALVHDGYVERVGYKEYRVFDWDEEAVQLRLDLWTEWLAHCVHDIIETNRVNGDQLLAFAERVSDAGEAGFLSFLDFYRTLFSACREPIRRALLEYVGSLFRPVMFRIYWVASRTDRDKMLDARRHILMEWRGMTVDELDNALRTLVFIPRHEMARYVKSLHYGEVPRRFLTTEDGEREPRIDGSLIPAGLAPPRYVSLFRRSADGSSL